MAHCGGGFRCRFFWRRFFDVIDDWLRGERLIGRWTPQAHDEAAAIFSALMAITGATVLVWLTSRGSAAERDFRTGLESSGSIDANPINSSADGSVSVRFIIR